MKIKKLPQMLNASEAAVYMGFSRQRFYIVRKKHQIPYKEKYGMKMFAVADLKRVRKLLDKWKAAHGQ